MWKRLMIAMMASTSLWAIPVANGQKSTEIYIPIGLSPGLSGLYTSIGTVIDIDNRAKDITLKDGDTTRVVHCSERTKFWLDKSKQRLRNQEGSLSDCRPGTRIEVKYAGNDKTNAVAEWVKVEITASN